MHYRESEETYLETILLMEERMHNIRRVDIAAEMGYSRASVSVAVGHLEKNGMVYEDCHYIHLTESGKTAARAVYEKHQLVTELLIRIGADAAVAEENASRIAHVISPDLLNVIRNYLNTVAK